MNRPRRHPLIVGARITSLGTLASRLLGMVRDMATAALLGLAAGGVMDAFVVAYRIPNLFRRLFGEGALTASYLPVLSAELEKNRQGAWQLASVLLVWLTAGLALLVLAGEAVFALIGYVWGDTPGMGLLMGLSAVILPYLLWICLAAQLTATLHALSHFTVPALVPTVLNIVWLLAVWVVAPRFAPDREAQAYVLAVAVVVAGALQVVVQWPMLRRLGFRFDYDPAAAREPIRRVGRALMPMLFGLAVTQINSFNDSLIAWGLAASPGGPQTIAWLGDAVRYPVAQGAAAAIYYGERLYHFPLGMVGLAVATAVFPLLSRHAARGQQARLAADLTLGLRLVVCLAVPAGVGLVLLGEPLARLLFERGQFTPEDTFRTARMIRCYGIGVWAFCALPVVVRGYYALGDTATPARMAAGIVGLNLALNLSLIWTPLAEGGLAVATSISAAVQVLALAWLFSRRKSRLDWPSLGRTLARTLAASLAMAAAVHLLLDRLPPDGALTGRLVRVLVPLVAGAAVHFAVYRLLRGRELDMLLGWAPTAEGDFEDDL